MPLWARGRVRDPRSPRVNKLRPIPRLSFVFCLLSFVVSIKGAFANANSCGRLGRWHFGCMLVSVWSNVSGNFHYNGESDTLAGGSPKTPDLQAAVAPDGRRVPRGIYGRKCNVDPLIGTRSGSHKSVCVMVTVAPARRKASIFSDHGGVKRRSHTRKRAQVTVVVANSKTVAMTRRTNVLLSATWSQMISSPHSTSVDPSARRAQPASCLSSRTWLLTDFGVCISACSQRQQLYSVSVSLPNFD